MAGGVHPRGHNGIGARIARGDVFAGIVVGDAEGLHHVKGRAIGGAGVAEVAVVVHVLGFDGGIAAERVVKLERRKAVCCALAVDESQDLLGVAFGAAGVRCFGNIGRARRIGGIRRARRVRHFGLVRECRGIRRRRAGAGLADGWRAGDADALPKAERSAARGAGGGRCLRGDDQRGRKRQC
jgi:uncharacterized protein YunC (DUF1805 family)